MILAEFNAVRPTHEIPQERAMEWLMAAYLKSDPTLSVKEARDQVDRYGCDRGRIARRGHELEDFGHLDWARMRIFGQDAGVNGRGMGERTRFFQVAVERIFERLYEREKEAPDNLIHVTCTGYASPSNAQRLVAARGWGDRTAVTHLYQMGCLAAFPALRIARGFLSAPPPPGPPTRRGRVDIIHTELCTLHFNPARRKPEDIVVQSLFSDGSIRYSAFPDSARDALKGHALTVLCVRERILPATAEAMTWLPDDWGMSMHLDKRIPLLLSSALPSFLEALFDSGGLDFHRERGKATFAVHPGGPRILDLIERQLELRPDQLSQSRRILHDFGNMSSATLPHIWDGILEDPSVAPGRLVVSLGFGPGLTIGGGIARKS